MPRPRAHVGKVEKMSKPTPEELRGYDDATALLLSREIDQTKYFNPPPLDSECSGMSETRCPRCHYITGWYEGLSK